jgi:ribosomal protein S28E/S33
LTKLRKVQSNLIDSYNSEFMKTLVDQSTDKHGRYKTVSHHKLRVGDVILLRDPMLKAHRYPLARVEEVVTNDMGEVTDVIAKRGSTGEITRRHTSSVIPFLQYQLEGVKKGPPSETRNMTAPEVGSDLQSSSLQRRPQRVAAAIGRIKTKAMLD